MFGIAEHFDVLAAVLLEGIDIGIDRPVAGPFDRYLDTVFLYLRSYQTLFRRMSVGACLMFNEFVGCFRTQVFFVESLPDILRRLLLTR